MKCVRCGAETEGTQNEGGITTALCAMCAYREQEERERNRAREVQKIQHGPERYFSDPDGEGWPELEDDCAPD